MIRDEHIRQWHHLAPWTHWGHVEQDLVICRAIMELKMSDPEYLNDMQGILRPDVSFDAHSAYVRIRHALIDKLMTEKDLESVNKRNKRQQC